MRQTSRWLKAHGYSCFMFFIRYILQNMVYVGDVLLQRYITENPRTHRIIENKGQLPRFKGQSSCHHRPGDLREGARKDQGKLRVQSGGASHRKAKLLIGENHLRQIRSTLRQGSDQNQQTRRLAGALVLLRQNS